MEDAAVVATEVSSAALECAKLPIITTAGGGLLTGRESGVFKKCACVRGLMCRCEGEVVVVSVCARVRSIRVREVKEIVRGNREEREREKRESEGRRCLCTRMETTKKKVGKETGRKGQLSGHVMARGQGGDGRGSVFL